MLTCHLDTYHWNRLAAGRLGADRFRDAVRNGKLAPALSFIHMLEFASREPEATRAMVGDFLDEISSLGTVKWVHLRGCIQSAELRNELNRFTGWPTCEVRAFKDCLTDT